MKQNQISTRLVFGRAMLRITFKTIIMDDNLFSLSCPSCGNSLITAFLCNPMFILHKADCPFCGSRTKLARLPVFLVTIGLLLSSISIYSLLYEIEIISTTLPIYGSGIGVGFLIFGLLFLRFVAVKERSSKKELKVHFSKAA